MHIMHTHLGEKCVKGRRMKGLSKNVCELVSKGHEGQVNKARSEFLANEVAVKFYVLGTLMKGWIVGKQYGIAIVKV